jgi:hypothetical protein
VCVLALQKVRALVPVAVIRDVGALLEEVKIEVWRPSEILLPMCIIAFAPLMLLINVWTKTCLIGIYHEFFQTHRLFVLVQITGELPVSHQVPDSGTFFGAEWQGVYLLFFFIKGLYAVHQVARHKRVQFVWR